LNGDPENIVTIIVHVNKGYLMRRICFFTTVVWFAIIYTVALQELYGGSRKPAWVEKEKVRAYWSPPFEIIEALHSAGFNAIIQRWEIGVSQKQVETDLSTNVEDYTFQQAEKEFRNASALCKTLDMHYFACLNTGAIPPVVEAGFENNPRRYHDGKLPCPLDKVYWDCVVVKRFDKILTLLSDPQYRLDGLIIDPEMYYFHGQFFTLPCYCRWCTDDFVKIYHDAVAMKDINAARRPQWLKQHNLAQDYDDWQTAESYELVKNLERTIHSKRPELMLGFYIYQPRPWFNVLAKGLSGNGVPIMICTETETFSGAYDDSYLAYEQTLAKQVPVPFINCPGIWVDCDKVGAVPERLFKVVPGNLYHRTILADGYFLYAMDRWGSTPEKAKPFTDVFRKINAELDTYLKSNGAYKSPLQPQPLPVEPPSNLKGLLAEAQNWHMAKNLAGAMKPLSTVPQLREVEGRWHVIIFKAKEGDHVQITMHTLQHGDYIDKGSMSIFGPDAKCLGDVLCDYNKSKSYDLAVPQTGAYAVVATASSNAYTIEIAGAPWVITASKSVRLNRVGGRLFFYVPDEMKSVKLRMGGGGEAADYTCYAPNGKTVFAGKNIRVEKAVTINNDYGQGVWCMEVTDLEDDTWFSVDGITIYSLQPKSILLSDSK
jgi:hypothetical protein